MESTTILLLGVCSQCNLAGPSCLFHPNTNIIIVKAFVIYDSFKKGRLKVIYGGIRIVYTNPCSCPIIMKSRAERYAKVHIIWETQD